MNLNRYLGISMRGITQNRGQRCRIASRHALLAASSRSVSTVAELEPPLTSRGTFAALLGASEASLCVADSGAPAPPPVPIGSVVIVDRRS
jgi:hypothetical protein